MRIEHTDPSDLRYKTDGIEAFLIGGERNPGSQCIPPHLGVNGMAELLRQAFAKGGHDRDKVVGGKPGEFGVERVIKDEYLDGRDLLEHTPLVWSFYHSLRGVAEDLSGRRVEFSPWTESAINAKRYNAPRSEHGWHVETNSLTVLLYFGHGSPLHWYEPGKALHEGPLHELRPHPGLGILLKGHDLWHCVPPAENGDGRMVLVMNYYHPGEEERPAGLDGLHYGAPYKCPNCNSTDERHHCKNLQGLG